MLLTQMRILEPSWLQSVVRSLRNPHPPFALHGPSFVMGAPPPRTYGSPSPGVPPAAIQALPVQPSLRQGVGHLCLQPAYSFHAQTTAPPFQSPAPLPVGRHPSHAFKILEAQLSIDTVVPAYEQADMLLPIPDASDLVDNDELISDLKARLRRGSAISHRRSRHTMTMTRSSSQKPSGSTYSRMSLNGHRPQTRHTAD